MKTKTAEEILDDVQEKNKEIGQGDLVEYTKSDVVQAMEEYSQQFNLSKEMIIEIQKTLIEHLMGFVYEGWNGSDPYKFLSECKCSLCMRLADELLSELSPQPEQKNEQPASSEQEEKRTIEELATALSKGVADKYKRIIAIIDEKQSSPSPAKMTDEEIEKKFPYISINGLDGFQSITVEIINQTMKEKREGAKWAISQQPKREVSDEERKEFANDLYNYSDSDMFDTELSRHDCFIIIDWMYNKILSQQPKREVSDEEINKKIFELCSEMTPCDGKSHPKTAVELLFEFAKWMRNRLTGETK
jgi:hypothetical protein